MSIPAMLKRLIGRGAAKGDDRGTRDAEIDWNAIDNYSTLYRTIPQAHFPDHDAFVKGPLERYLQLIEAASGRGAARIMEHMRASVGRFRDSERAAGRPVDRLDAMIDDAVRARFSYGSDNDRYMIEVFEGRATHNFRGRDDAGD